MLSPKWDIFSWICMKRGPNPKLSFDKYFASISISGDQTTPFLSETGDKNYVVLRLILKCHLTNDNGN